MITKRQILEILEEKATNYMGGYKAIPVEDFDDVAEKIYNSI
jgi:hypothetical protein